MSKLVCYHVGDALLLLPRGSFGVHQERGLSKHHQASVLHGSNGKTGHSQLVVLAPVVGNAKIIFVPGQEPRRISVSELPHPLLAAKRPNSDGCTSDSLLLCTGDITYSKGNKVRGHRPG